MNPRDFVSSDYTREASVMVKPAMSEFDRALENAEQYFGFDFPGNEGLTCRKCGAAVNLGWQHIAWHEAAS